MTAILLSLLIVSMLVAYILWFRNIATIEKTEVDTSRKVIVMTYSKNSGLTFKKTFIMFQGSWYEITSGNPERLYYPEDTHLNELLETQKIKEYLEGVEKFGQDKVDELLDYGEHPF